MAVPDVIPILHEPDYRTDRIGRYDGGQFVACVTGATREGDDRDADSRVYSVLHLFDRDGAHVRSDIWLAGTSAEDEEAVDRRAEEQLTARLDALPGREYGDIAIRLFRVDFDGLVFGLLDESDEERGDWAEPRPNDLGFYPPWDGEYDT
jgi:formate hydrogenlyase regulatory protein HycA